MDYNYSSISNKAKKYMDNNFDKTKIEEYVKAYDLYKYLNQNYSVLCKTLEKKIVSNDTSDKIKNEKFSMSLSYFCKLIDKNVSDEFKSLIDAEVDTVNQILKNEPKWNYLHNCSFKNFGDYVVKSIDYQTNTRNCTGSFSEVALYDEMYGMVNSEYINLTETSRFYNKHYDLLEKLHGILLRKNEILNSAYNFENPDNLMEMEVLKVLAYELGANSKFNAYEHLIKNKKSVVASLQSKVKIFKK